MEVLVKFTENFPDQHPTLGGLPTLAKGRLTLKEPGKLWTLDRLSTR